MKSPYHSWVDQCRAVMFSVNDTHASSKTYSHAQKHACATAVLILRNPGETAPVKVQEISTKEFRRALFWQVPRKGTKCLSTYKATLAWRCFCVPVDKCFLKMGTSYVPSFLWFPTKVFTLIEVKSFTTLNKLWKSISPVRWFLSREHLVCTNPELIGAISVKKWRQDSHCN